MMVDTYVGLDRCTPFKTIARETFLRRRMLWKIVYASQQNQQDQCLLDQTMYQSYSCDKNSSGSSISPQEESKTTSYLEFAQGHEISPKEDLILRQACEVISRPSVLFAHETAKALAEVVYDEAVHYFEEFEE